MNKSTFAVAITLIKQIPTGQNIQTALRIIDAVSSDEARGMGVRMAQFDHPEHSVFTTLVAPVPKEPSDV